MKPTQCFFWRGLIAAIFLSFLPSAISNAQGVVSNLPVTNGVVYATAFSGNTIYIGGAFTTVGGLTRNRIAAIDATTGSVTSWNPNANSAVYALAVSPDLSGTVYAGGGFTSIGGQTRNRIAAIDASTGSVTSWNPNANGGVFALALSPDLSGTVYAGGDFTSIGDSTRYRIAALSAASGLATIWNPHANFWVYALALSGSTVYAGGSFNNIGGQTRYNIAAIDATTGSVTSWNPNASHYVYALAVSPDLSGTVYAGGVFTSIGGQTRNYIAAIAASSGLATSWNPNAGYIVHALALSGSTVYVGGEFTSIGGQTRNRIAALDANTNTNNATSWNPNANGNVLALALDFTNARVYAGGYFTTIFNESRAYFAGLTNPDDPVLPITLASFTAAVVSGSNVMLEWVTISEVNNYGFYVQKHNGTDYETIEESFQAGAGYTLEPQYYTWTDESAVGNEIIYRLKQIDNDGLINYHGPITVLKDPTGVKETEPVPAMFALNQNYPNPFNPSTTIRYEVPHGSHVNISIHNTLGQSVVTLVDEQKEAGRYHAVWDGSTNDGGRLSSGIYFCRIQSDRFVKTIKLVLLK